MKINFLCQFALQSIFPDSLDRMKLTTSELIELLKFKTIEIESLEMPMSYLPRVIDGEYICLSNSSGVMDEPKLSKLWPKNSVGELLEDVYILADMEVIYQAGDYKRFLVKPKRMVDVIKIFEFEPLEPRHNLGIFRSISTGTSYWIKL